MKSFFILISLLFSIGISAQNLENIGIDNTPYLNKDEALLLNNLLKEQIDTLSFENLKVAFITGNFGRTIVSKSDYFKNSILPWIKKKSKPQINLILLTKEEKEKSGGYCLSVIMGSNI